MTLPMSRPWKHPESGFYWLRKRVPDDLRLIIGKREEKLSLGTRDPDEAKRKHAAALLELEARWANLRKGERTFSGRELKATIREFSIGYLTFFVGPPVWSENAPTKSRWPIEEDSTAPYNWVGLTLKEDETERHRRASVVVDGYSANSGLRLSALTRKQLISEIIAALDEVASAAFFRTDDQKFIQSRFARPYKYVPAEWQVGGYAEPIGPITHENDRVALVRERPNSRNATVTLNNLVDGWAKEKSPREKTLYSWRRVVDQLASFLDHDDASKITRDDLVRWKASLLEAGLRAKTIRDGKLAPIRAILQWGVDNRRLELNPAERVTIDLRSKPSERKRGYNDDEARLLLQKSSSEEDCLLHWVPWICAYSGARVSEVCQLRAEDVFQSENIWCIHFSAEAGNLKNISSERLIPIHSALLERGFLDFVKFVSAGALFAGVKPDRFNSRGGNGTKIIGRWVRSLGLADPRLSPSHSWRHRLRTLGRRYGLATDVLDAITGHQRRTVADTYGEFPISALQRELGKIPILDFHDGKSCAQS